MKLKIFLLFILISFIRSTFACEVHLPKNVLILSNSSSLDIGSDLTGCPKDIKQEIMTTLNAVEGRILSYQFNEILKSKNFEVSINPEIIHVQQLKHLIREQLNLPLDIEINSVDPIQHPNLVSLSDGDKIEVKCHNCVFNSDQILSINIYKSNGSFENFKVRGEFKRMVKAYYLNSFVPAFSAIKREQLIEKYTESIPHTDFMSDLEVIKYYKTNKPIKAGELLKKSDLNGINLVRAGNNTEVVIENQLLKLKTSGISRSNGIFGDLVEVQNIQKNKKYLGRVIDINKILVDL